MKNFRFLFFVFRLLSLLIVVTGSDAAENQKMGHGFLVFATGFGIPGDQDNNQLQLGVLALHDGKASTNYYLFDGKADLAPTVVPVRLTMRAPYGEGKCKNRYFNIATSSAMQNMSVQVVWGAAGAFSIKSPNWIQQWETDPLVPNAYVLKSMQQTAGGRDYPISVGYAFWADDAIGEPVSRNDFIDRYRGDIFHKDMNHSSVDEWDFKKSSLVLSNFIEGNQGRTLELSTPGILKSGDNWAHNGILLNYSADSHLILFHDYGHDFNHNGCYDEPGHSKTIYAAKTNNSDHIKSMVYVEYTFDGKDGFPMLSVGRYYE